MIKVTIWGLVYKHTAFKNVPFYSVLPLKGSQNKEASAALFCPPHQTLAPETQHSPPSWFFSRISPRSPPPRRRGRSRGRGWRGWPWGGTSPKTSPWGWRRCAGLRWSAAAGTSPSAGRTPCSWPRWWPRGPRRCRSPHPVTGTQRHRHNAWLWRLHCRWTDAVTGKTIWRRSFKRLLPAPDESLTSTLPYFHLLWKKHFSTDTCYIIFCI